MSIRRVLTLTIASFLVIQGLAPVSAQPTAEHKRLDYLVGKWRMESEIRASAAAPASKASGTEDCELFANLHVVCRGEITGAAGLYRSMRTISYVPAMKQYASHSVDSLGYVVLAFGQITGDSWTFTSDVGGVKTRYTMKTTPAAYTATTEYAGADGKFVTTGTVKAARGK
jgi:hypothetical protein